MNATKLRIFHLIKNIHVALKEIYNVIRPLNVLAKHLIDVYFKTEQYSIIQVYDHLEKIHDAMNTEDFFDRLEIKIERSDDYGTMKEKGKLKRRIIDNIRFMGYSLSEIDSLIVILCTNVTV